MDYDDLLNQFEGWDMMVHKRGRRNAPGAAAAAVAATVPAAVPPPVPAAVPAAAAHPLADNDPDAVVAEIDRILADPFANAPPSPPHHHQHSLPPGHRPPPPAHLFSDDDDNDDAPKSNSQYSLRQQKRVHYSK